MSGLNSLYIASVDLEEYFVSNQSAEALAGGTLSFFVDTNRTQPKQVFTLVQATGFPFNYSYQPLPNPLTLSNSGTPMDANGNNVAIYYYPFDQFGNVQLYYVECYDAFGNLQFTREAWPFPNGASGSSSAVSGVGLNNMLTNPQFTITTFAPSTTITIPFTGNGTLSVIVAPDWTLNITHTGAGNVTVTQNAIAGNLAYPYNPPFTLTVVGSANVTALTLSQQLNNNPDWAAPQVTGMMGYLSGSILLAPNTGVNLQYMPSSGNPIQTILTSTNTTGAYSQATGTIQLEAAANSQTGAVGFDQIIVNLLNTTGTSTIGNVQVIPLTSNASGVQFDQTPANRQVDQMFNYYNPWLQFMPNPSYLVGWDFAVNPAQPLGSTITAQNTGNNTSYYTWDNTILFQNKTSAFAVQPGSSGGFTALSQLVSGAQLALVQYIPNSIAQALAFEDLCVMFYGATDYTQGYPVTISLWYTTSSLPSVNAGNSIVATLDANGKPATLHGTWTEIPRNGINNTAGTSTTSLYGNATFTLLPPVGFGGLEPENGNLTPFSGWSVVNPAMRNTNLQMAIVVGTGLIPQNFNFSVQSISLQIGIIPTVPAPKSFGESLAECQQYYEMSFNQGTVPAQNVGTQTGEFVGQQVVGAGTINQIIGTIPFKVTKIATPTTITLYNPANTNAQPRNETIGADCSSAQIFGASEYGFYLSCTTAGGSSAGNGNGVHWTADSRLGL